MISVSGIKNSTRENTVIRTICYFIFFKYHIISNTVTDMIFTFLLTLFQDLKKNLYYYLIELSALPRVRK